MTPVPGEVSVPAALCAFRDANGLAQDDHVARLWSVRIDFFAFPLPNFAWRKRAIAAHDMHHLLTGYPCTAEGELLIAAWEWGAGRYPHWGATLFCSPLVLAGFLWTPAAAWAAFQRGRRSRSLYAPDVLDRLGSLTLDEARAAVLRGPERPA